MCVCATLGLCLAVLSLGIVSVGSFLTECDMPACGRPDRQPASFRIVGGQAATMESMPWMAIVARCTYMACGGAILNDEFILTAAHCFYAPQHPCYPTHTGAPVDPNHWSVYVGKLSALRPNAGEQHIDVDTVIPHPLYNNHTSLYDVALLKLRERIHFSSIVKPVCLPTPTSAPSPSPSFFMPPTVPHPGQQCMVAGYGETYSLNHYSLRKLTVPILSDESCSLPDWYGDTFFPPYQFCAGFQQGGRDACSGDSGSPLICNFNGVWYANGIVSKGFGCAEPKKPGVYSNISFYEPWIRYTMAQYGSVRPGCP